MPRDHETSSDSSPTNHDIYLDQILSRSVEPHWMRFHAFRNPRLRDENCQEAKTQGSWVLKPYQDSGNTLPTGGAVITVPVCVLQLIEEFGMG